MEEKYLPVGTVCLLKGGSKRVMVIGFGIRPNDNPDIIYDYLGCLFPEGIISLDQNLVFNHDQIEKIVFKGYSDEESKKFNDVLKDAIAKMDVTQAPSPQPQQGSSMPVENPQPQPEIKPSIPEVEQSSSQVDMPSNQFDAAIPKVVNTSEQTPVSETPTQETTVPETPDQEAPTSVAEQLLSGIQPSIIPVGGNQSTDINTQ